MAEWFDLPALPSHEHCHNSHAVIVEMSRLPEAVLGKVGTIFEDSPIELDQWAATWLIGNCKSGVSSCEIARDLGITQKSAWFVLHRIRRGMRTDDFRKLGGEVEVDESFICGKAQNLHKAKRERVITRTGGKDKTVALGMVKRSGQVRASS